MDKEKRKEQILECAKKLFAVHGYYGAQISDIIREAGIARGTFYRYFTNKKDIFVTLLENYYHGWTEEISLESKRLDLKTISPEDYFRHRVKSSLLFFANDPYMCKITLRMGLGLPSDMENSIKRLEDRIIERIKKDLILGINNKNIYPDIDVELTANLVVGSILRISYYYFALGEEKKTVADVEQITDGVCRIYCPGLFPDHNGSLE
ncbi:MAG: TetR/AcrR family transcriptional regulator [Thermodesulfobacteriota bacterium]